MEIHDNAILKTELRVYLLKRTRPVELVAAHDDDDKSRELRDLLPKSRTAILEHRFRKSKKKPACQKRQATEEASHWYHSGRMRDVCNSS